MPCKSVHMCFMRYPLDIIFLDKDFYILHITAGLRPWRLSRWVPRARAVLECPAGWAKRAEVSVGCALHFEPRFEAASS